MHTIIQLSPADKWFAVMAVLNGMEKPDIECWPLSNWAIVDSLDEETGSTYRGVIGLAGYDDQDLVTKLDNFLGYVHDSERSGGSYVLEMYKHGATHWFEEHAGEVHHESDG